MEINVKENDRQLEVNGGKKLFQKGWKGGPGRKKKTEEQRMIEKTLKNKIMTYLEKQGVGAASRIVKISKDAMNEQVRLNANKDVLDRIGAGVQKNGTNVAVQVNISNVLDQLEND